MATLCRQNPNSAPYLVDSAAPIVTEALDQATAARRDAVDSQQDTDDNALAALHLVQALLDADDEDVDDGPTVRRGLLSGCPLLPAQLLGLGLGGAISSDANDDTLACAARAIAATLDVRCREQTTLYHPCSTCLKLTGCHD